MFIYVYNVHNMNKITTTLCFLLISFLGLAQVQSRTCSSMDHLHSLELSHPEIIAKRNLIESQTQSYINNPIKPKQRAVITIPVVVHVVYNTASQNISDAQIQSQINVLNADFRKLNADIINAPAAFQAVAADCEIQFVLAKRNPMGDSSNGITRTQTIVTSFSYNDNVKHAATGGKDAWPSTDYLNIWVTKLSSGLLGYAQFPGGPTATDGVVISFRAFGTMGSVLAPFNKGRTTTHEVGHWMNLYHIWGDDGGSCNGSDLVNDTPNQGAENYGVPVFPKISCANTPNGDMFMNYMDYTDDIGMNMFTAGQKVRMEPLFLSGGARFSILSSLGGTYPTPTISCGTPSNINSNGITSTSATVNWDAVATGSSYTVQIRPSGSNTWTTYTSSLTYYTISGLSSNTAYEYQIQATCTSGTGQFSPLSSFTTAVAAPQTCGNPTSLLISGISHTNVSLDWQAVQDATTYTIQIRELGIPTWTTLTSSTNNIAIQNLIPITAYEYQVSATCPYGTSEFSASKYFNTLSAPPPSCSNNYEPNNSLATAVAIEKNTLVASILDSETDNDYFAFTTTAAQPKFKVSLTNMPADYDMKIYNSNGVQVFSSQNGRLQGEVVVSNNSSIPATYTIRVLGYNGKFDPTNCYRLFVETSNSDFKVETSSSIDDASKPQIVYYPNPAYSQLTTEIYSQGNKDVQCTIYNSMGRPVFSKLITTTNGLNTLNVNVDGYANGIYMMELIDSEERKVEKFTVQH